MAGGLSIASIGLGLSFGAASSSSSGTFSSVDGQCTGEPFVDMVKETKPYGRLLRVRTTYEIYIHNARYHWLLLVRMKDSELPFITLEVTSPNMKDLTTVMGVTQSDKKEEKVGEYEGTIVDLCKAADEIVKKMGGYGLFSSNCQHFCNNVLKWIGLKTFPTTVGPEVTVTVDDKRSERSRIDTIYGRALGCTPAFVGSMAATGVGMIVRAPNTRPNRH